MGIPLCQCLTFRIPKTRNSMDMRVNRILGVAGVGSWSHATWVAVQPSISLFKILCLTLHTGACTPKIRSATKYTWNIYGRSSYMKVMLCGSNSKEFVLYKPTRHICLHKKSHVPLKKIHWEGTCEVSYWLQRFFYE